MDKVFINYPRQGNYEISLIHNGLSDQDAQLISIHNVDFYVQTYNIQNIRKINKYSLAGLNYNIGLVTEDDIFDKKDVNSMFNSFINIFLQLFNLSFPKIQRTNTVIQCNM